MYMTTTHAVDEWSAPSYRQRLIRTTIPYYYHNIYLCIIPHNPLPVIHVYTHAHNYNIHYTYGIKGMFPSDPVTMYSYVTRICGYCRQYQRIERRKLISTPAVTCTIASLPRTADLSVLLGITEFRLKQILSDRNWCDCASSYNITLHLQ